MLDTQNDRALTVQQAAEFLGVSEIVLLDLIHTNKIEASNIGRGPQRPRWRILSSSLGKYMVANRQQAFVEPVKPKRTPKRASKDYFGD